jgi:hypothetical protein
MPTARIIFRGLIAFIWDDPENQPGRMAAVFVDAHQGGGAGAGPHPSAHQHIPRISWIGQDGGGRAATVPTKFSGRLRFRWNPAASSPHNIQAGADFFTFVPTFKSLGAKTNSTGLGDELFILDEDINHNDVHAVVLFEAGAGTIEVTDYVRFWRAPDRVHAGHPASGKVRQRDIEFVGVGPGGQKLWPHGLASECTLTFTHPNPSAELIIESPTGVVAHLSALGQKAPLNDGHPSEHDVTSDDVEVLITHFAARSTEPLPFSTHYQMLFGLLAPGDRPTLPAGAAAELGSLKDHYAVNRPAIPAAAAARDWDQALQDSLDQLVPGGNGFQLPFPVIRNPKDAQGRPIFDADDREMCPPGGGGK